MTGLQIPDWHALHMTIYKHLAENTKGAERRKWLNYLRQELDTYEFLVTRFRINITEKVN